MANPKGRKNFSLKRCLDAAKKDGTFRRTIDFTEASFEMIKQFNVPEQKRQHLLGFMQKQVENVKINEFKRRVAPDCPKIIRKYTAYEEMRSFADMLPTAEMSRFMQRDILIKTGMKKQCEFYSDTYNNVISEFRQEYVEATHRLGINSRIKPLEPEPCLFLPPYKYKGRTDNYNEFLKNRKRLKRNLFIMYPLMRKILKMSIELPPILLNISSYRHDEYGIPEIAHIFNEEVNKGVAAMKKFHFKVSKVVRSSKSEFPTSPRAKAQYVRVATALLSNILSGVLRATILHIMEATSDPGTIPFLKLNLTYDKGLMLKPSATDTFDLYKKLIDNISTLADNMLCVESMIDEGELEMGVPIYISDEFKQEISNIIWKNIEYFYKPVNEYVQRLEQNFASLYPDSKKQNTEDITFEEGCDQIDFYVNLIEQIENIVTNEYYAIGAVEKEECKANLKASIYELIDDIAAKLLCQHEYENHDICITFSMLAEKAKRIPKTSEELMEQGAYMTWANTVLMTELTARIQNMLTVICHLMDIATISAEHMRLNAETVGWLWKIKPILEYNSSMYESYKFDFEERLANANVKLKSDVEEIIPLLKLLDLMNDSARAREYVNQMASILVKIRNCEQQKIWINNEETTFKYPVSQYVDLEDLKNWIYLFYHLVKLCMNWNRSYAAWMYGPFEFLEPAKAEEQVEEYYKELMKIQKMYRNKLKQMAAEQNPRCFAGSIDDPDPLNQPAPLQLCRKSMAQIKEFRPALALMGITCNTALLQRHWDDMSEIAGFDMTPNAGTTLFKITQMDLGPTIEPYEIISSGAVKELQLISALKKMIAEWTDVCFKTSKYKERFSILTALDDIQVILDDHIMKTLTMRGSIFVKPYEAEVKAWYEKIMRVNSTIDEWGKVQAQWLYLLPIFSSKDIVNQMPNEGILFREVDGTYKRYMAVVDRDPHVMATAGTVGLLEAMVACLEMLEKINEGVTAYLETKRLYFPRFFFLSNDEMLEILSETKDPLRVQPHLRKCFEAINKLDFDAELHIHAMISGENEKVKFENVVKTEEAGGSVEKWLVQVEQQMLISVREQIRISWLDYPTKSRTDWMQVWPGQVVLAVSQIFWTTNMHIVLNPEAPYTVKQFTDILFSELKDTVALVRDPNIANLARISIKALIVIDVHAKDVAAELHAKNVVSDNEFKWLCQLRYYWENERCMVRILNASVKYANEYLGNSDRLVITPLTDRCYRTLVGAYHLHLNGAPEGPAGTGKTETTKDLAKALAVQCVVFNCSDGLDYKAMGKFFKGLASAGAWACFDEFNRIEIEVLSVVAQQILCIVLAVRANAHKFNFEGTELVLNPACYVCITMNPGYAGRSELPDNLKVLFRTVAMMVPDYAMIGEISLYSYGFVNARVLSVKIVTTYKLCSEQLSSQNHYDYGMRAVKSVLSAAGNNKRAAPNEDEDIILLRSITDVNLAKFLNHDVPLFEGIISDLFPGVSLPSQDYGVFIRAMKESCKSRNLQPRESFRTKVIQTYEMMIVRHGFMLVGEPFAGKTSTLKVLGDSLTIMNDKGYDQLKVQYQFMNPKSITMGQLYGQFDPVSYEWFDGVIATCFRDFVVDPAPDRKWVIFDGPVDAVWIENMNTVLDDNKKLCLMSGEVMVMTSSMSMIFEVMDLAQASPATVSRCGMIYMEPATLGWRPFFESWIVHQNPEWCDEHKPLITDIFNWVVDPSLYFIRKNCKQLCSAGEINLVKNMYQIFEYVLNDAWTESIKKEEDCKHLVGWIQATFLYAGVWGLGSILDSNSRAKFDGFYRTLWKNENEDHPYPPTMEKLEILIPNEGQLGDYVYVYRLKGTWKYWHEVIKNMRIEDAPNIQQVIIPTIDTVRYMSLLDVHIKHKTPMLLVGPTGTGKSYYVQDLLMKQLDQELYEPSFVTFTVKISANQTQDMFISKLHKLRRGRYGPPKGKTSVIFVDDLNMPVKESYGAQPPIELLRQYFDHGNWYDLKDTSPIYITNLLIMAAMGLVGGSRQDIYQRFLRHFSIFAINEFSEDSMTKIFCNILLLGWKKNGFPSDIINTVSYLVNATLNVYISAIEALRPTPAKSHYIFNLRDFSRVVIGCSMLKKDSAEDRKIFPKLWVHEIMRVFYDRLVDPADKNWLYQKMRACVREYFKEAFDMVFDNMPKDENGVIPESCLSQLLFGTYLDQDATEDDMKYEEVVNMNQYITLCENAMEEYNATHKSKMDIVLFQYALEHLSRVCRILSIPSGSSLMVGVSGSGRQSLTKLATAINNCFFFQPEISKNYGMNEWREDLKRVLKESGGKGRQTTFLFSEGQIKEEGFLGDIDCLLNSGEVPNIFPMDEKQEILELVRLAAQGGRRNLDVSALAVFDFFIKRSKEKLHMMLCFSPIGASFRSRLRMYPALVNCCTIDWYEDWPEDSLERVAQNWIEDINLDDNVKKAATVACKHFHVVARQISDEFYKSKGRKTYVTSASYLELIKSFTQLTNAKQLQIRTNKMRYLVGLDKLQAAADAIAGMQKDLEEFQPQLLIMTNKAVEMTKQIERETLEVEKASNQVRADEKVANIQASASQALKRECEADLAEAIPVLEEAIAALNTLKPADITLVKSMKNPPEVIKVVMAAVCVMKDIKPDRINDPSGSGGKILDYWGPSKKLLGDMNFLQNLKDFDKDNIKVECMAKIRKEYLPNKLFKPNIVAKASSAAEGLCKWIIAMDMYDAVAKEVAPKKEKLEKAEREYAATVAILLEKKETLAKLEEKLANLNELLDEATKKQQELQDNVNLCANKLMRAEKLLGGLGGEKSRWKDAAEALQTSYDSLAGDILISCGLIAYLSPFTMQYRTDAVVNWHKFVQELKIPCTPTYEFATVLGSDIKIQMWYINGLPRDAFSTENGIIQDSSRRWSLLIDPQSQANIWIKKMEKKNEIEVTKFSDSSYMKTLEKCIQLGKPALIENIEEDLEAPLDPLIFKQTFFQAGIEVISLGDNVIPYNKAFQLYLTSKLRNPHYLPEVFNKVTIINFSLTVEGLEDQLLGIVVAKERPDLQRQREELIIQSAENKAALARVEENILRTLSESQGDILEDESAIEVLDFSKVLSNDIMAKQKSSKETEKKIEGFRLDYKPIAQHSAVLYYTVSDLPNVDPMYQYSLGWFINLYISSIEQANKSRDLQKRLAFLKDTFTYNLYSNVCRSLFEKDKLMFSFILCTKIMLALGNLTEREINFLLTGGINVENPHKNPATWLVDKSWNEICRVEDLPAFQGFKDSFVKSIKEWQNLFDVDDAHERPLPAPWDNKLSSFQRLIAIRLIRPDKLYDSISKYVSLELGSKYIQPPPFDIAKSYEDSSCICPLIFILSPGTDPMAALVKFAEARGFSELFSSISLGQGQGPIAQDLIQTATEGGAWVCLQNCHLAVSWMPTLEQTWEAMDLTNTHQNFRLWLTSYPSDKFPISILQYGVKMTNEPPSGLQQNILRSYSNEPIKDPDFYAGCVEKEEQFARLLYGISFFHAVIQERKSFGPLGWNIPYGFNESDMDISIQQLQMFLNEYEDAYEAVTYLTGECNYGGRVTDDWDRRLIVTILADFINPDVVSNLNYEFVPLGEAYMLPRKYLYDDYIEHIMALPQVHPPEVFGLHKNAGITRDLKTSNGLLDAMIKVRGEGSAGDASETDKLLMLISSDILSKIPKPFDLELAKKKYPVEYSESMNTVLVQEMERFNKLLNQISSTLINIQKAVAGLVILTPALELLANSLLLGRIPAAWASVSYPSLKSLPNYVTDFVDRLALLQKWYLNGKPASFWLSGFFFTQAFLTGAKQNYARKFSIPIDQLTFDFTVLKELEVKEPPPDGVFIYGLFTDGARWDLQKGVIAELYPKILNDTMPIIWIFPILVTDFKEGGRYKSPLYKTSERRGILSTTGHSTNFVMPFYLGTRHPPSHWVKRSMALLCQVD